jgi:two-component system cell cycle response regulator
MTARVLVVDDIPSNVMLLKAQLSAEYFEVQTASNGQEALAHIELDPPDIVLLDIMMPGLSGYEVCKRVRRMPGTASLPIVMVTALDRPNDRVAGFDAGADDFLTKPVDQAVLLARVRGLVRLKLLTDELQQRQSTARSMGVPDPVRCLVDTDPTGRILVVEDRDDTIAFLGEAFGGRHDLAVASAMDTAISAVNDHDFDLVMISLSIRDFDGLRLCSRLRATTKGRHVPILVIAREDEPQLAQAFELGVNDCIVRPIDKSELLARVKWLLRKKRYTDELQESLSLSLNMATLDELTGLYNRRFMDRRLELLIEKTHDGQPLTLMMFDIDHFKRINDEFGHDVGDEVLRTFAGHLGAAVRTSDLVCRYGGEEFVVLMRNADLSQGHAIAERVRLILETTPIEISRSPGTVAVTVSVGLATANGQSDTAGAIFHRADQALYRAKQLGRNQVCEEAVGA